MSKDTKVTTNEAIENSTPVGIPINNLVQHPEIKNRKLIQEHVDALESSIQRDGLESPLLVYCGENEKAVMKIGDKEVPMTYLIAGGHRLAAIKKLRKSAPEDYAKLFAGDLIPCIRVYGDLREALSAHLRENCARENPSAQEIFPFIVRLKEEFKLKGNAIAKRIGKSEAYVSQMLSIAEDVGSEAVAEGDISVKDAANISKTIKDAKKAGKSVSEAEKKELIEKAKTKQSQKKAAGRTRDEKRVSGKKLWEKFKALKAKGTPISRLYPVLLSMSEYIYGETNTLPSELTKVSEPTEAKKADKSKK